MEREEPIEKAARLLAQALGELQALRSGDQGEISARLAVVEGTMARLDQQLASGREQQATLSQQLTGLAQSLNRLVGHLEGLSQLLGDLLERMAEASPAGRTDTAIGDAGEPAFQAGGEGVSLILNGNLGFQALMDIQKSLLSLPEVAQASVERFQEGESRIQVSLAAPLTERQFLQALNDGTRFTLTIEEAQPELARLRLKVVAGL